MPVTKNLAPVEARRCAAEAESIVWALILIMVALIAFVTVELVTSLGG